MSRRQRFIETLHECVMVLAADTYRVEFFARDLKDSLARRLARRRAVKAHIDAALLRLDRNE
jgi:hypothetical protein